jgi:hypothetical protein
MKNCKAQHIFVITDSCYSSQFIDLNREAAGNLPSYFYKKSRHVLASGRGIVSDGPKGKHSPFASVLIDFLEDNSEKYIFASQLIAQVKKMVDREHSQMPFGGAVRGVNDEGGEFIFFLKDDVYLDQIKADFNNLQKEIKSDSLSVSDKIKQCSDFQEKYRSEPLHRLSKEIKEVKDIISRVERIKRELEMQIKIYDEKYGDLPLSTYPKTSIETNLVKIQIRVFPWAVLYINDVLVGEIPPQRIEEDIKEGIPVTIKLKKDEKEYSGKFVVRNGVIHWLESFSNKFNVSLKIIESPGDEPQK